MKSSKKLIIGFIPILCIGIVLGLKPIVTKNISINSNIYGTPANSAFTDENFYKCVIDQYNSIHYFEEHLSYDDVISDEQLASMEYLYCRGFDSTPTADRISSVDGIEKLTSLKTLWLTHSNITNINLSNQTNLEDLYLYRNQSLESIDLSQNTNLIKLKIDESRLLVSDLNLNNKTRLETLTFKNDFDKSSPIIDLSNNLNLKDLWLENIGLESINVTHLDSLEKLDLRYNELSNINLSNNVNLVELDLAVNHLTGINLSSNSKLTKLELGYNSIRELDLSHNSLLTSIDVNVQKFKGYFYKNIDDIDDLLLLSLISSNGFTGMYNSELYYKNSNGDDIPYQIEYNVGWIYFDILREYAVKYAEPLKTFFRTCSLGKCEDIRNAISISKPNELSLEYLEDKILVKNGNEVVYEFNIIDLRSDNYNLQNSYIYDDISNIINDKTISNSSFSFDENNNKIRLIYNGYSIKEFDFVKFSSNSLDLSSDYLVGPFENIVSNIDCINCSVVLDDLGRIQIMYGKYTSLKQYKYVYYSSDSANYDINSDYFIIKDSSIDDFLSHFNCTGCSVSIVNSNGNNTSNILKASYLRFTRQSDLLKEISLFSSVDSVSFANDEVEIALGGNYELNYTIYPYVEPPEISNVYNKVSFISSNPSVATVDENGLVTAKSLGNAIITVKTEDGEFTDTCNVVVTDITTYTVTYKDGNKTYTEEYEEGEKVTFKSDLEKKGYKLVGWKYNNQDYKISDKLTMPSSDIELVVIWELVIPEIKNYLVNEDDITGIALKTDINNINLGIDSIYNVKVFNHDGTDKTSGLIATGDKMKIYLDNEPVSEYEIIIKGDVTGTGTSTVSDVAKLYQYLKKKIDMDECFIKAGNVVDSDNEIKVNDVAKLYQFIKGKIDNL